MKEIGRGKRVDGTKETGRIEAFSVCFSSQPLAFYLGKTRQVIGSYTR
jgi:hypothetical protein